PSASNSCPQNNPPLALRAIPNRPRQLFNLFRLAQHRNRKRCGGVRPFHFILQFSSELEQPFDIFLHVLLVLLEHHLCLFRVELWIGRRFSARRRFGRIALRGILPAHKPRPNGSNSRSGGRQLHHFPSCPVHLCLPNPGSSL